MVGRVFSDGTIQLSIAADTADYNIYTSAGSPSGAVNVTLTIASGVVVYQNAGTAAIRTGSFAGTATVTIINRGTICGKGGNGGNGGAILNNGANGSAGGDAIYRDSGLLKIDNTAGNIFGGGGGGGGGGGASALYGGGGGGGGRGRVSSTGGSGGGGGASSGTGGDYSASGTGGAGIGGASGDGGDGGDWGDGGENGSAGLFGAGGSGGAAGYALRNASGSITWLGGYNSSQVRGQVS